jgi:hypothetical protein
LPIEFVETYLYNAGIVHLGNQGESQLIGQNSCTPNAAVGCYGHRHSGPCIPGGFDLNGFYNVSDPAPEEFEWLVVRQPSPRFTVNRTEDRMRNLLMDFIRDDINGLDLLFMRQLDSRRRGQSAFQNFNQFLEQFGRSYNLEGGGGTDVINMSHFSGRIAPFGPDVYPTNAPYEYDVDSVIPDEATTSVTVTVTSKGRYFDFSNRMSVSINGFPYTMFEIATPGYVDCDVAIATITIDVDFWNNNIMAGTDQIHVVVQPIGINLSTDCDGDTYAEVTIAYTGTKTREGPAPFPTLHAIDTLTGRLRKSGHELNAEWVLVDAAMDCSVHLHRVNRTIPTANQVLAPDTYPLVVLRVRCHMGVRIDATELAAFNAAGHTLEGSALVLEENYAPDDNFPTLVNDVDEIEWTDPNGDAVRPPSRVIWKGQVGWRTDPQTENIGASCGQIAAGMIRPIPAMNSHRAGNPGERNLIWTGSIGIRYNGSDTA